MRVLFVAPHAPHPATFGGRLRVASVYEALRAVADTRLLVVGEKLEAAAARYLGDIGAAVFEPRAESTPGRLLRIARAAMSGRSIPAARYLWPERERDLDAAFAAAAADVIVLGDTYLAELVPLARRHARRVIVDTYNVESLLHRRTAAISPSRPSRWAFRLLAANTARIERRLFPQADRVWAVSEADAAIYRRELAIAHVDVVPNVVEVPARAADAGASTEIVYVGLFAFRPNEDAALRLVEISRRLDERGFLHRLTLVGAQPTACMKAAVADHAWMTVAGEVADVAPYLSRAGLFVAPLAAGSGVKFKVLQALAAGLPVLTTPIGAEGIALVDGTSAMVRPLDGFVDAAARLHGDAQLRRSLGREGRALVERDHSPAVLAERIAASLSRA